MTLVDVCDFAESLAIADHVYMGDLPEKDEKSIGVYNSKHQQVYHTGAGRCFRIWAEICYFPYTLE